MAKRDQLTEDLKYRLEMMKLVWLSLLGVGGGTIGVVLGEIGLRRAVIMAGIAVTVGIVGAMVLLHRGMRTIIQQLEDL